MFRRKCKHRFNPTHYGRFDSSFQAVDGIGREHRIVERQCDQCDQWVETCKIHMPRKETKMEIEILHSREGDKKKTVDTATEKGRQEAAVFLNRLMKQGAAVFLERGKKSYRVKSYDPANDTLLVQTDRGMAKARGSKSKTTAVARTAGG